MTKSAVASHIEEMLMDIKMNRKGSGRSVHSKARGLLGAGAASVLVIASLALVGVLPAAATATLAFGGLPSGSIAAGSTFGFTVAETSGTATDSITISSSCTLTGTLTETASGGTATFAGVAIDTSGSCTLTATDTTSGGTQASSAITVTPLTAVKLGFKTAPPSTAAASTALPTFTVATEDTYGNVVTSGAGLTDTINITSSCALSGTTSAVETAGLATFSDVIINTVGACPLLATDTTAGDTGFTPATYSSVNVTAGAPAKLVFTTLPPTTDNTIGAALTTFAVSVEDANGNVEKTTAGSTDLITITASGCTIGGTDAEAAVAGVATFAAVTATTPGTCVLTATDSTRTITTATATTQVGTPQATLTVTSLTGYKDAPLTLVSGGGSGTGAVTFSVTNGTATGCLITNGALTATTAGTCIVTASKAAAAPYASANSVATTVTISSAPKAIRVSGTVINNRKSSVTVTGYNFSGRPKVISNVAGFSAVVTHDSGTSLTVVLTIKGNSKPGVKTMTITLASGARTSVKYSLHG
jgi:hypothetical protein